MKPEELLSICLVILKSYTTISYLYNLYYIMQHDCNMATQLYTYIGYETVWKMYRRVLAKDHQLQKPWPQRFPLQAMYSMQYV